MRKVWTRIATVVLILVVGISFSACSLFTTDLDKKYSPYVSVASTANNSIWVSRQELYYAYLQWGSQYASSYDSTEELLKNISTSLLNNKILEKQSIDTFGELDDREEALALKQAYQSLDTTLRSYIYEKLGQKDETTSSEESTDNSTDQTYTPKITVKLNDQGERVYTLNLSEYADEEATWKLKPSDYQYYTPTVPGVALSSDATVRSSISKIIRNLENLEKGFTKLAVPERDYLEPNNKYFKYLNSADRAVLNREIERMVKSNCTSILVSRWNTAYDLGFTNLEGQAARDAWQAYLNRGADFDAWCESVNQATCGELATKIAEDVIEKYISDTADAINAEKNNFSSSSLESDLTKSSSTSGNSTLVDLYYIPQDVAKNLFTVSHILIGYTDKQTKEYENIQTRAKEDPNYDSEAALAELQGKVTSDGDDAYQILNKVTTELAKLDNVQDKYNQFREFINQYNSDPGMQNLDQLNSNSKPKYEYLMSVNEANNSMVEEFTKASIDLKKNGNPGDITTKLVWTKFGAHIIMYTRDVSDFIFTAPKGNASAAINELQERYDDILFQPLTAYGTRTLFDTMVDNNSRSYADYRTKQLGGYEYNYVTESFKDFLKR